uniref:N-methyl-L-tryptophan oxidase n=1 Tax=Rhodococcus qingshengii TaxID=334542 RepID=UPI001C4E1EEE|nr:N-methyl-L-tryptophan oxidase [Rhodococcus qingshengii]
MTDTDTHYDAIVVGLGAWGSATLAQLSSRGLSVLGIDQHEPPHRNGSHHGNGRIIRMASPEGDFYTPMMQRAYALWRELEQKAGVEVLTTIGGIYAAPAESPLVSGALESFRSSDIEYEVLTSEVANDRFPWIQVKQDEIAIYEPSAGRLHPERSITAHLDVAKSDGAEIRVGVRMLDWREQGDRVLVLTSAGELTTDKLILTLGSWAPHHLKVDLPLVVERQIFAVYDASDLPGPLPLFVVPSEHGEAFYGLPEAGDTYKVALHHGGETGDTEELSSIVTEVERERIASYVSARLPQLPSEPLSTATCKYTNTPDRHFVLAVHPDAARVVLGAGCSGRGYKFASFIGEALADLATDVDRPDLEPFSPRRFRLAPSSGKPA